MNVADTVIVLPTYNEIENLERMVGRIRQSVAHIDVLIVDDASPDGTGEVAERLAAHDAGVTVLHRVSKDGLGAAYLAGFSHAIVAGYQVVIEMDADGSHDPQAIPAMLELLRHGADLVIGSRWVIGGEVRNWPWMRLVISRLGNRYSAWVLGSAIKDLTSGFRVFRAPALAEVIAGRMSSQGYSFQVETAWRCEIAGAVIAEHPIIFVERTRGRSKMHIGIVWEALWRVTVWGFTRNVPRRNTGGGR